MQRICSAVVVALLLLGVGGVAAAEDKLRLLEVTPPDKYVQIPDKVQDECGVGREIPMTLYRDSRDVVLVKTEDELTKKKGRYLVLEIIELRAPSGGIFSGPKKIGLRGALFQDGKEIADVQVARSSTASLSTCASLNKVEKVLGQDLARWLRNPRPNSRL